MGVREGPKEGGWGLGRGLRREGGGSERFPKIAGGRQAPAYPTAHGVWRTPQTLENGSQPSSGRALHRECPCAPRTPRYLPLHTELRHSGGRYLGGWVPRGVGI